MIVLKSKIPCENCAKAIKTTLKTIPEVDEVECSVKDSEIKIILGENVDEGRLRLIVIEELRKTGRICDPEIAIAIPQIKLILTVMRFLSLLAHVSSLLQNSSHFNNCQLMNSVRSLSVSDGFEGKKMLKMLPISAEEADKIPTSAQNYIKKLEMENQQLTEQLKQNCKLLKSLSGDMSRMQSERLYCMIFETYQRFRSQIGMEHDESGKIDTFLEAVKKGKQFTDDKIVHWMINFESSDSGQLLKEFRNQYSHYTSNDLNVLRQWRTKLIEDSFEIDAHTENKKLNEAAVNVLSVVIEHLSEPESKPLIRKNLKEPSEEMNEKLGFDSRKLLNKMERKRLEKQMKRAKEKENKQDVYQLYNANAQRIAQLRKHKNLKTRAVREIQKLRDENRKLVKEFGIWITKSRREESDK